MKDLFGAIADIHLTSSNIGEVTSAFKESIDTCKDRGCKTVFLMGDIFTNRKSLEFEVLQAFDGLLNYCLDHKIDVIMFPGNHDKISYHSERSYLDIYRHFPGVTLITEFKILDIFDRQVAVLPFFDEKKTLPHYLNEMRKSSIDSNAILLTHIAVDGVKNNDGSVIEEVVNRKLFKTFDKVLVGHYHDKQIIDNIVYIGSLRQNNHGEDDRKGITFVKQDGSLDQVNVSFKKYLTVDIDLEKYSSKELEQLVEIYEDSGQNIRFKFQGTKDQLKKINKNTYSSIGIDVSYKEIVVDEIVKEEAIEFGGFDKGKIIKEWGGFCETSEDYEEYREEGKELLEKI